jgi:CrcB protein
MLPWGTLAANMMGGYLVGLLLGIVAAHPEWPQFWRLLLVTGFLGGLTTFSTFSAEVVGFVEEGRLGMALSYAGISLAGSLVLTFLGLLTAHSLRG